MITAPNTKKVKNVIAPNGKKWKRAWGPDKNLIFTTGVTDKASVEVSLFADGLIKVSSWGNDGYKPTGDLRAVLRKDGSEECTGTYCEVTTSIDSDAFIETKPTVSLFLSESAFESGTYTADVYLVETGEHLGQGTLII